MVMIVGLGGLAGPPVWSSKSGPPDSSLQAMKTPRVRLHPPHARLARDELLFNIEIDHLVRDRPGSWAGRFPGNGSGALVTSHSHRDADGMSGLEVVRWTASMPR
jgi:hypothetical protein